MPYPSASEVAAERARALLSDGGDLAQVQDLLLQLGLARLAAVAVTKDLIDGLSLHEAMDIVLNHPARAAAEFAEHLRATAMEYREAIAEIVRELDRPAVVAFDGPGIGPAELADLVARAVGDAVVVSVAEFRTAAGLDWARLRDEVLVPARTGTGLTLVHGMFLLTPELAPYFRYRVYFDTAPATSAEEVYLRSVWPQWVASLVVTPRRWP